VISTNEHFCRFNEQNYCILCGEALTEQAEPTAPVKNWPRNTWFQRRLAEVRVNELSKLC
jgi:hypothetical protein